MATSWDFLWLNRGLSHGHSHSLPWSHCESLVFGSCPGRDPHAGARRLPSLPPSRLRISAHPARCCGVPVVEAPAPSRGGVPCLARNLPGRALNSGQELGEV